MAPKQASGRVSRAKPAVQRPARRAAPPKSPKKETLPAKGGNGPISFQPGGLHKSLGVPQGQPIPPGKMADALAGKAGPKAKSQALFARNVLKGGSKKKGK
jgi:hypothetical protein